MKASHNSMSYLQPVTWWGRVLRPWSQCQNVDIAEQFRMGVRYFDIRIAPEYRDGRYYAHYCHGVTDYGPVEYSRFKYLCEWLDNHASGPVYIRICLDVRRKPKDAKAMKRWFLAWVDKLKAQQWYWLKVDSIKVFWEPFSVDYGPHEIAVTEKHWSVTNRPWYEYIMPLRWYARRHNAQFINEFNEYLQKPFPQKVDSTSEALMIDFWNVQ